MEFLGFDPTKVKVGELYVDQFIRLEQYLRDIRHPELMRSPLTADRQLSILKNRLRLICDVRSEQFRNDMVRCIDQRLLAVDGSQRVILLDMSIQDFVRLVDKHLARFRRTADSSAQHAAIRKSLSEWLYTGSVLNPVHVKEGTIKKALTRL